MSQIRTSPTLTRDGEETRNLRGRITSHVLNLRGPVVRTSARVPRPRRKQVLVVAALLLGVIAFMPLFKWNLASTAPTGFFDTWDRFSESLVLAKIESTTPQAQAAGTDRAGLLIAGPNAGVVYETFNGLATGTRPLADQYDSYISNLGLQGFLFLGAYNVGCTTVGCLETLNSAFTALALVGFAILLAGITRRSFAIVFLITAAASPWIVASARNLYWMPSSWFLPACAAVCFVTAATRRRRLIAAAALFACFALRFGMGYEYITSVTLLAAAMPLLAFVFNRSAHSSCKIALRDSLAVVGVGVVAFLFILVFLMLDVGNGDIGAGATYVWDDATKRTYGGTSVDPGTVLSRSVSPLVVLARYTIGWNTDIVAFGKGTPLEIVFGPQTLWILIVLAALVVLTRFWTADRRRARDAFLLAAALSIPVSWYLLAKAHSFVHTPMNYVLWYMLGVSTIFWIILAGALDLVMSTVRRQAALLPFNRVEEVDGGMVGARSDGVLRRRRAVNSLVGNRDRIASDAPARLAPMSGNE